MADNTTGGLPVVKEAAIGDLPGIADLYDDTLLPVEQQGEARHMTGAQWKRYAQAGVTVYVEGAKESAASAAKSAWEAKESAKDAANSADKAEQYSGKPPKPLNGTWRIWDADTQEYIDTGIKSVLSIVKSYPSIASMQADLSNMEEGDLVIIASSTEDVDNSKLFVHSSAAWIYLSDLSGLQGVGIANIQLISGDHSQGTLDTYKITLTDGSAYDFQVYNGAKGDTGDPAGFGSVTATVDDSDIGTPSVEVEISGPNTAKNLSFSFKNLKGRNGAVVEASGFYAFNVNDEGHLILSYAGDQAPDFSIKEDGHLYVNIA